MEYLSKAATIAELEKSFASVTDWIKAQPEAHFNKEIVAEKWTIAQHLYHLIKSARAVNKGLKMPKLALRTMFGKNNRAEKTYDQVTEKYRNFLAENSVKAPKEFSAESGRTFTHEELFKRFEEELADFKTNLEKWSEEDLSTYLMLHPAIGKCTIREMLYFVSYHNGHHLRTLKEQYVVEV